MKIAVATLTVALLAGCGEVITIENSPPVVEVLGLCQPEGSERWYLKLATADAERALLDLRLTDAEGRTLAPGPTGSGYAGLPTEAPPARRVLLLEWAAADDAATCEATTADLPGPKTDCIARPDAPGIPLTLTAYVDDTDGVFSSEIMVADTLAAADCAGER